MEKNKTIIVLPPEVWCHILSYIGEVDDLIDQNAINIFFSRQNLKLVSRLFHKELLTRRKPMPKWITLFRDIRIFKDDTLDESQLVCKIGPDPKLVSNFCHIRLSRNKSASAVKDESFQFPVITLGTPGCGKTSFLTSYTRGHYKEEYKSTIGAEFSKKKFADPDGLTANLNFWDFGGQARYQYLMPSQYRAARALLLCFSISDRKSLITLFDYYVQEMSTALQYLSSSEPPVIYLVGLKSDLEDQRQLSTDEAKTIARVLNMKYFECSAKLNQNLNEVMEALKDDLLLPHRAPNTSNTTTQLEAVPVHTSHHGLERGCGFCQIQ